METKPAHQLLAAGNGGPPVAPDELAARRTLLAVGRTPGVLVVDTSGQRIAAVRGWARRKGGVRVLVAGTTGAAIDIVTREQPEVAVVDLLYRDGRGIAVAVEMRRLAPELEIVFVVGQPGVPEVQAAWDLGWERIVAAEGLDAWLDRGLTPLCRLASLRRQTSQAQQDAARLAAGNVVPTPTDLPLSVAERRYRESFLRAKLATAGGRREAARLAGVPYTTFCVMLRKLGIRG
jgi:DNA-binding NtrC family response regulator